MVQTDEGEKGWLQRSGSRPLVLMVFSFIHSALEGKWSEDEYEPGYLP